MEEGEGVVLRDDGRGAVGEGDAGRLVERVGPVGGRGLVGDLLDGLCGGGLHALDPSGALAGYLRTWWSEIGADHDHGVLRYPGSGRPSTTRRLGAGSRVGTTKR